MTFVCQTAIQSTKKAANNFYPAEVPAVSTKKPNGIWRNCEENVNFG
jgi:hypothetical protein